MMRACCLWTIHSPASRNNATELMSCADLTQLPDILETEDSTTYVDLQFIVTFDVAAGPDELWRPSQFYERLLKHFEPWVAFPQTGKPVGGHLHRSR